MKHEKIGFLVLLLLISFASLAFASLRAYRPVGPEALTAFWPVERNQSVFNSESISSWKTRQKLEAGKKSVPSETSFNYQAWRLIHASA